MPGRTFSGIVCWAIGRILLQELGDGRCHISCEVVGDPSDPMTTQRTAIFKPLGLELTRQMEAAFGATPEEAGPVDPPLRPPEAKEMIESKIIPCERCGAVVAMLVFAPDATDPRRFEDYARKMYPQYTTSTCRPGSLALHWAKDRS
jgi:hypothetical protein